MKIPVRVTLSAKCSKVQIEQDGSFAVWLTSKPVDGEANLELVQLLAKYFKVSKSKVRIAHGAKNRNKLVEVDQRFDLNHLDNKEDAKKNNHF